MADPTMTSSSASTTTRPAQYGGTAVGKSKAMRKLTSKRKQKARRA
jgi:hypothetical protein